jgi:hypothetical protein
MAELTEVMGEFVVRPVEVAAFMKRTFSEANVAAFIQDQDYASIEAFIEDVQRGTKPTETLPFD